MKRRLSFCLAAVFVIVAAVSVVWGANPVITNMLTADPAALVYNGRVYLYTGHDEAPVGGTSYVMNNWCCFSSSDMVSWTYHGTPLAVGNFSWARADAWASQVV